MLLRREGLHLCEYESTVRVHYCPLEFLCMWIRGGKEAESVSSNNESFGDLSKAKYHVNNMTQGECGVFAEVFRIFQNRGSPVLQEESNPNIANDSYDSRVYES